MSTTKPTEDSAPRGDYPWDPSSPSVWHKSAPKSLRKVVGSDGKWGRWDLWGDYLSGRKPPISLAKLLPGDDSPLCWGICSEDELPGLPAGLAGVGGRRKKGPSGPEREKEILGWLSETAGSEPGVRYALEAIAWAHALPELAVVVTAEVWWELLGHLLTTAIESQEISLEESPLIHQLLAGELPATLAGQLPEIVPCRRLAPSASRAMSAGLVDLTDGRGFLHAKYLDRLGPLLACWTRCRAMACAVGRKPWTKTAEGQYAGLIRNSLRLARPDGSLAFSPIDSDARPVALLRAAIEQSGSKNDRKIAGWSLPGAKKNGRVPLSTLTLPDPSVHSEWAGAAVLRRSWRRRSERLDVAYTGKEVRIELSAGAEVFFSGVWELDVNFASRPAGLIDEWQEVCWFSDEDVDYLELQAELTGGLRVQRHLLLAREERFLLLADSILGPEAVGLDYFGRVPLCPGVEFRPDEETREGMLVSGKRQALVLPAALPEWRIDSRVGELAQVGDGLELRQSTQGRGLMAPLVIDLAPRRCRGPRTWRQLAVAESLEPVGPDVAVGYRVAVGHVQWLIYRSIGPCGNRTVLGQNYSNEMIVSRFRRSGEAESLLYLE